MRVGLVQYEVDERAGGMQGQMTRLIPHLEARGFWHEVDGVRLPGSPFRFVGDTEPRERPGRAAGADSAAYAGEES